jgi:DNA anti-recombination protein RmuC
VSNKQDQDHHRVVALLGLGLDNEDGHQRLTRNEHFLLIGGSADTHEQMQETAIKFSEALKRRGKELNEAPLREVLEIFQEIKD